MEDRCGLFWNKNLVRALFAGQVVVDAGCINIKAALVLLSDAKAVI
jgi:hypothetical protein